MSTPEDRAHDAERDARTPCPECSAQGIGSSLADCPGHEPEALPDPDTLDLTRAIRFARFARLAAGFIRREWPDAAHEKAARGLDDYAEACDEQVESLVRRMGGGS